MSEHKLDQLHELIKSCKEDIDLGDALTRLEANPDFIKVIAKGYLVDTALRLVRYKGSPDCTGPMEVDTNNELMAIGKMHSYLDLIRTSAQIAVKDIESAHEAIAEIEEGE